MLWIGLSIAVGIMSATSVLSGKYPSIQRSNPIHVCLTQPMGLKYCVVFNWIMTGAYPLFSFHSKNVIKY